MTFTDSPDTHVIRTAPVNFRDLGGLPVDGGLVRPGVAFRSDDVSIAPEDWAGDAVGTRGLRHVIDLRSPQEATFLGRGPLAGHGALGYHHLPLTDALPNDADADLMKLMRHATTDDVGLLYLGMLEKGAAQLATALSLIASGMGAVVFHCAAGKDRTGILAAALLTALGADDDTIVADYAVTGENLSAILRRVGGAHAPLFRGAGGAVWQPPAPDDGNGGQPGPHAAPRSAMFAAEPASMASLLTVARDRHGSLLRPLQDAGLHADTLSRLRQRLIQPVSGQVTAR
ncbi:tyrosine-protein phosphatase [Phytoactinopolyspora endophytica]|uniref:tyrosine-protein phosphatase n=1 Tax=Phytoactinopolyspora endophytica TaxID=1642495 RepID=UPI00101D9A54|nr:tyrosine-protein phosphatase [Phytoactinopolyspora endophytica]